MPHRPPHHPVVPTPNFAEGFFAPARIQLDQAPSARVCPELSDDQWLLLGVRRALEDRPSGRAFLQHLVVAGLEAPTNTHFFETLKSGRWLALIAECSHGLARTLPTLEADLWGVVPELAGFEVHAGDGHFHAAAAPLGPEPVEGHDAPAADDGIKYATGHFFSLNLRTHALAHLTVADQVERKKPFRQAPVRLRSGPEPVERQGPEPVEGEHDMRALKRLSLTQLRQGTGKGRKVL